MPLGNVDNDIRLYQDAKNLRQGHEQDWREASKHCYPQQYSSWQTTGPVPTIMGSLSTPRREVFDTTAARSLWKFMAILERLATPVGSKWAKLEPSNPALKKSVHVRRYFDELTTLTWDMRYNPMAKFRIATGEMYAQLGVYGSGPIFVGSSRRTPLRPRRGMVYISCPMRDVFVLIDDEGNVTHVFRRMWLNLRQFKLKFPDTTPPKSMQALEGNTTEAENRYFEFVHYVHVCGFDEHDREALDYRRHAVWGIHIAIEDRQYVGEPHGYASMPYLFPRSQMTVAGDPYAYSPAVLAYSAIAGASQMKKTGLKQGQKAVDPVLIGHDDGVLNGTVDQRPGAYNPGGVNSDGRPLIHTLPVGNFQINEVLLQDERKDIEDNFFVTLFNILQERPEMTATEVIEHVADRAALLSPTMGRLQTEFLDPNIRRELEVADELGILPEMPPELVEARGEYDAVYTSPMAKSMYAEEVSGYMRSFQWAAEASAATGDPSILDPFDLPTAIPEITDYLGAPSRWMRTPEQQAAKQEARSEQQQDSELLKNAPAIASAFKTATETQQNDG